MISHLTWQLPRRPAGQFGGHIAGLIRQLAATAVNYRRAKQCRTRVIRWAIRRRLGPPDLLKPGPD